MHLQEPLEGSLSRPGLPLILFSTTGNGYVPYLLFSKLVGVAYHTGNFPAHCQTSATLFSLHQIQLPVRKKGYTIWEAFLRTFFAFSIADPFFGCSDMPNPTSS